MEAVLENQVRVILLSRERYVAGSYQVCLNFCCFDVSYCLDLSIHYKYYLLIHSLSVLRVLRMTILVLEV